MSATHITNQRLCMFKEWFRIVACIDRPQISADVYSAIVDELGTEQMTIYNIPQIIMKLKIDSRSQFEYVGCAVQIICHLKGLPPISGSLHEEIEGMFTQVNEVSLKHFKTGTFFQFSYVVHKLLQILKQHEYLQFFPLTKNTIKLSYFDSVWKLICVNLNWQYISS